MNEHAPGWYEHQGERRYWDGAQWTHGASTPAAPAAPTNPPPPPAPAASQVVPYAPPAAYGAGPSYGAGAPPFGAGAPPFGAGMPPYGAPGVMPVARKEPGIALLISLFIPGVGSMMNGDVGAGAGFLGLYVFGLVLVLCLGWLIIGFIGLPLMLVAWGWSMFHAYQGAVDFNRRAGYQS